MEKLLNALRRNPDVVAIAVLCLTLGIGRHVQCARVAWSHPGAPVRIHWVRSTPAPLELPAPPAVPEFCR
ncbi:MAG: hypothetical protein ACM336_18405 [Acidobacteriota bacterium]